MRDPSAFLNTHFAFVVELPLSERVALPATVEMPRYRWLSDVHARGGGDASRQKLLDYRSAKSASVCIRT